jgi:hypothetical protein
VAATNQIVIKKLETLRDSELCRKLMNASDSNLGFLKAFSWVLGFQGFRVLELLAVFSYEFLYVG